MGFDKRVAVLLAFAFVGVGLSAQEGGFTFRPLFSGGGPTAALSGFGGKGEVAFLFYDSGLQISSHIVGRGNSVVIDGDTFGVGSLGTKLSLGGFWRNATLRSYAFVEGGIGAAGGNSGGHLVGLFGGGGGLDWLFTARASLYIEFGYLQYHVGGGFAGGPALTVGARSFHGR